MSPADVAAAASHVNAARQNRYADRYEELLKARLLEPAEALARAFAGGLPPSPKKALLDLVAGATGPDAAEPALSRLAHAGFVWRDPGGASSNWSPVIPNLMRHVLSLGGSHGHGGDAQRFPLRRRPFQTHNPSSPVAGLTVAAAAWFESSRKGRISPRHGSTLAPKWNNKKRTGYEVYCHRGQRRTKASHLSIQSG